MAQLAKGTSKATLANETSKAALAKETSKAALTKGGYNAVWTKGTCKLSRTYKTYNVQSLNFHKTVGKTFSYLSLFRVIRRLL